MCCKEKRHRNGESLKERVKECVCFAQWEKCCMLILICKDCFALYKNNINIIIICRFSKSCILRLHCFQYNRDPSMKKNDIKKRRRVPKYKKDHEERQCAQIPGIPNHLPMDCKLKFHY